LADLKWDEVSVNSWAELIIALEPFQDCYRNPPTYVFRGQASADWDLKPSLLRRIESAVGRAAHLKIENWLTEEFLSQAALFPETSSVWELLTRVKRSIERWTYMQHHGCVTRLLDWTASPYIAAYFAVYGLFEKPGAIYIVAPGCIDSYREEINGGIIQEKDLHSLESPNHVFFAWPHIRPRRVVTQQGNFSLAVDLTQSHDLYILQACNNAQIKNPQTSFHKKIIIQPELKPIILQQLCAMNITPHALFPGLDGLGRSLSDFAFLKTFGL
jgi:hypothetical protein